MSGVCSEHRHHELGCPQCEATKILREDLAALQVAHENVQAALDTALTNIEARAHRDLEWCGLIRRAFL
jgi:hypothetical protein